MFYTLSTTFLYFYFYLSHCILQDFTPWEFTFPAMGIDTQEERAPYGELCSQRALQEVLAFMWCDVSIWMGP